MNSPVTLTQHALDKAIALLQREGRDDLMLRLEVTPGGCAGLKQNLQFDPTGVHSVDNVFSMHNDQGSIDLVIDNASLPHVTGTVIDYRDGLDGGFSIENPNITASCACGNSFN
jgi:iron-sulfur cluster assembly accessory protein